MWWAEGKGDKRKKNFPKKVNRRIKTGGGFLFFKI